MILVTDKQSTGVDDRHHIYKTTMWKPSVWEASLGLAACDAGNKAASQRSDNQNRGKATIQLLYHAVAHNAVNPSDRPAAFSVATPDTTQDIMIDIKS